MYIVNCENYDQVSSTAAKMVESIVSVKPDCVLGLATGSTPIGMYEKLVEMYKEGALDFSNVKTFNLDEYYPISRTNKQSYYYFMNQHLYSRVNLSAKNIHIPNGEAKDAEAECANYEKTITECGGIDLQVLGIGGNGHIGFNEPDSQLVSDTHLTRLTEETIKANARFFDAESDVPRQALTMGMATILHSDCVILLVSGKSKREPLKKLLSGKITTECPATFLHLHKNAFIIADKDARQA